MADEKLNPQEEIIKRYLEEQIKQDAALRALYVPSKIKECFNFIKSQAQKKAVNGCAMIEDAQVFKWARDYYLGDLPKTADKETVEVVQKKAEEEKKPEFEEINGVKYDSEGNGCLFDF